MASGITEREVVESTAPELRGEFRTMKACTPASAKSPRALYLELLETQAPAAAVAHVLDDLNAISQEQQGEYVRENVPQEVLWQAVAAPLRAHLAPMDLVKLAVAQAKHAAPDRQLLLEAARVVGKTEGNPRKQFWNIATKYIEFEGFLWDLAPTGPRKYVAPPGWGMRPVRAGNTAHGQESPTRGRPGGQERRSLARGRPDWLALLKELPSDEVVARARAHARATLNLGLRSEEISRLPAAILFAENAADLRGMLLGEAWQRLYRELLQRDDLPQWAAAEFIAVLRQRPAHWQRTWAEAIARSPHRKSLEPHVPPAIRLELSKIDYAPFFRALEAAKPFDPTPLITFKPAEVYGGAITETDLALSSLWVSRGANNSYEQAKMLSARMAERAAARFYTELGHETRDVAAEQVDSGSARIDWKTHDILLDGEIPIDVKNSRTSINNGGGYSEHAVPRFKESRSGCDVTVVGVRSPYFRIEELKAPESVPYPRSETPILVLGECRRSDLLRLRQEFVSDVLQDLTLGRQGRRFASDAEFLPSWVFDLSSRLGETREGRAYRDSLNALRNAKAPDWGLLREFNLNPLPLALQVGGRLLDSWTSHFAPWERALVNRILGDGLQRSLPRLFLSILTDFLFAIRDNRTEFDPSRYRELLFPGTRSSELGRAWDRLPLGIPDPLESVSGLITSLSILWRHRGHSGLTSFTRFRFNGAGLLRGTRSPDDELTTILAYCGGWIPKRGKCGHAPLVLGREEACPECKYLVCPKCAHCTDSCPEGVRRKQKMEHRDETWP